MYCDTEFTMIIDHPLNYKTKYMKLKSYDKKLFILILNIFLTTLKMNKCQRVCTSLKKNEN